MGGARTPGILGLAVLLALVSGLPVRAWAPETRVAMADEAVRLMPASLSTVLGNYREDLLRGILTPLTADGPDRRAPWAGGSLDVALAGSANDLEVDLGKQIPFGQVVEQFGRVAFYVMEAGFPPGVSRADGEARYAHFSAFCDSRRERFPLVFYGHENASLAGGGPREFALRIMRRASDDDEELARAYAAAGDPPDPQAFDDRSVPFAIGSLAYSRTVTNVVQLWLDVWSRAGGDMERTPYLGKTASGSDSRR